jgi:hypothetical protein
VLAWRFGAELRAGRALILAAESKGKLAGYLVMVRRAGTELAMNLYDVADLQVVGDSPAVTRDILLSAIRKADEMGADAVKFSTGTPAKRAVVDALRPYSYQLPLWQLYFKTTSPALATELASADQWDFSLFETF